MRVVDLFCGAGGFSEGFRQAGFDIVAGVDNWVVALQSFKRNFPDAEIIYKDVAYLKSETLPQVDVLIGSPPCKEWSIGRQGKRTFDNSLIMAFQRIVKEAKPKYWVWECVPPTLERKSEFCTKECDVTSWFSSILDSYNFGVPQKRQRAFFSSFVLPTFKKRGKNLDEVFNWKEPKVLFNHRALNTKAHSPIYLSNRPARTAVTWPIRIYKEGVFTVDMMKQVQGFPESFQFAGSKTEQYIQIGNAVCPPVAKAIAEEILYLEARKL